ncbi:hypothetical protein D0S45_13830 [Marinifilum sp. JC120]|nr:hypothetical protein D0S45_13830 [Marinifilum sp. JC120]
MSPTAGEGKLLGKVSLPQTPSHQNFLISFAYSLLGLFSKNNRNILKDIAVVCVCMIQLAKRRSLIKSFGILKPFSQKGLSRRRHKFIS